MSGLLPEADPALTYAVLVGIDTYGSRNMANLTGPALDACRHAAWLRSRQVPAENIRLLISPGGRSTEDVDRFVSVHGLRPVEASEENVWRVLTEELPHWRGDLLWFGWGGHGILDKDRRHRLFFTDAGRDGRLVNLMVTDVEEALLHDPRYAGIARKVCVVDACREFVEVPGTLPVRTIGDSTKSSPHSMLLGVYATQNGSKASNLNRGDLKTGVFSSFLLKELEKSEGLPPDFESVLKRVKEGMADAEILQVPFLIERGWDGSERTSGRLTRLSTFIRTHAEELGYLRGKGTYLQEESLPFVSPGTGHKADPGVLLQRLTATRANSHPGRPVRRGLLLVGKAGAGKTRTCFEVARLAQREEWRVLHVSTNADVTVDDLMEAVDAQRGRPVLLVFDYLDTYERLDLVALDDAMQEMADSGSQVACIASVRPGARSKIEQAGGGLLFEEVGLRQDPQHFAAIARRIFSEVAPRARAEWGYRELSRVCGDRPVIALLIAREIESRFDEGRAPEVSGLREGELLYWLQKRTEEDFLERSGSGHAGPRGAATWLLASTVAAASCAQTSDGLARAVDHLLEVRPDPNFPGDGRGTVDRLLRLGWLVRTGEDVDVIGDDIDVVHDIVTDELLQQSLIPDKLELQGPAATTLFNAVLTDVRTFGRFVRHFRRWATDLGDEYRSEVRRVCDTWLKTAALRIEELVAATPGEGSQLLRTLLSGAPWQSGAAQAWDSLVEPWLRHAERSDARLVTAFYADALDNASDTPPQRLLSEALDWLARNHQETHGQMLMRSLLKMTTLLPEQADVTVGYALSWLDFHCTRPVPNFVLRPLLERGDRLNLAHRQRTVEHALTWLDTYPDAESAPFVLRPLLTRRLNLSEEQGRQAVGHALAWLGSYPDAESAQFVLRPLLSRRDLTDEQGDKAVAHALSWLGGDPDRPTNAFVLRPLMQRPGLSKQQSAPAADYALGWLGTYGKQKTSDFVLSSLLGAELSTGQKFEALRFAFAWLGLYGGTEEAAFVLGALFGCSGLTDKQRAQALEHSRTWLRAHGTAEKAYLVLESLLKLSGPGGSQSPYFEEAFSWLGTHPDHENTGRVLSTLLELPELTGEQRLRTVSHIEHWLSAHWDRSTNGILLGLLLRSSASSGAQDEMWSTSLGTRPGSTAGHRQTRAVGYAFAWLTKYQLQENTGHVLSGLLEGPSLTDKQRSQVVDQALTWLDAQGTIPNACHVLRSLLRYFASGKRASEAVQLEAVVSHALTWLGPRNTNKTARYVLSYLLTCLEQQADRRTEAIGHALVWLRLHTGMEGARYVLSPLLGPSLPDAATRREVVGHAMTWLGAHGSGENAQIILVGLLKCADLDGPSYAQGAAYALAWLDAHGTLKSAQSVLAPLLDRDDLDDDAANRAVAHALLWLKTQCTIESTQFVLHAFLGRAGLDESSVRQVAALSLAWLDACGTWKSARFVLARLLERPDLDDDAATGAVAHALNWLDAQCTIESAQFVLHALLRRPDLTGESSAQAADHALAWLAVHKDAECARFVLAAFLPRRDLGAERSAKAVRHAFSWLSAFGAIPRASYVLEGFLEHRLLSPDEMAVVIEKAFTWLAGHGSLPRAGFVLLPLLGCPALSTDQAAAGVTHAVAWLGCAAPDPRQRALVLEHLRQRTDLTADQRDSIRPL